MQICSLADFRCADTRGQYLEYPCQKKKPSHVHHHRSRRRRRPPTPSKGNTSKSQCRKSAPSSSAPTAATSSTARRAATNSLAKCVTQSRRVPAHPASQSHPSPTPASSRTDADGMADRRCDPNDDYKVDRRRLPLLSEAEAVGGADYRAGGSAYRGQDLPDVP